MDTFRGMLTGLYAWPLYLWGGPGVGKTCGVLALCDHVKTARYVTASELTSLLIASFKEGRGVWDRFAPFDDGGGKHPESGAQLVVLDELGCRTSVTDTQYEAVHRLLDLRDGQPLIIVSNHPVSVIGEIYDARIASRCEAGTVLNLKGPDRRTA